MAENEVLEVPDQKVAGSQTKQKESPIAKQNAPVVEQKVELPTQKFAVPKRENRVFILEGNKTKGTVTIMAVEDVIDPETVVKNEDGTWTGRPRRQRLLRGATSVWMDEQKQFETIKGYVEKNTLQLVFQKGSLVVPVGSTLLNQFINQSNRNLDNPYRQGIPKELFREWDTDKQNEAALKAEEMEFEAMGIAASARIDDIIPHAQYLGVDFIDPMSGHSLDEKGIRTAYMRKAKVDPKKFMNSIHSPVVQISHKVRRGVEQGKIDLGREANQAFYSDGGFISVVPQGRNAIEFLTEFAQMQNEASKAFLFQLEQLIK